MIYPATTAVFASLLALLYAGLSIWVVTGRVSGDVLHGDGGEGSLNKRIRSHGNFAEYVPLALVLVALLEAGGAAHGLVLALLIVLLVGRLLHPIGMFAPKNSPQQFVCRGGGILATMTVLIISSLALLVRVS